MFLLHSLLWISKALSDKLQRQEPLSTLHLFVTQYVDGSWLGISAVRFNINFQVGARVSVPLVQSPEYTRSSEMGFQYVLTTLDQSTCSADSGTGFNFPDSHPHRRATVSPLATMRHSRESLGQNRRPRRRCGFRGQVSAGL
ncbi:hypothetical protein EXIGLDRAFT_716904 [Exidia glandulosa HHB12029]|uniref:Uncharacterized protein n=1 Tax=Exidia glandulosa HHB12029 TaxID=1314781 RepID=A0A165INS4_EXIGL|nr:hypothetical protein EXIGLDRAFT_716904 [Exidia glandulosa HHB12029]